MISHFLNLEWKQFFRSASFSKSVGAKILIGFFALYFAASFLILGIGAFYIIKDQFPEQDPLVLVNSFLMYAIIGDLIFRYIMQKLPVMNIKPMLVLPISRSKIVHFILGKSALSFFNILGLFFYIPFAIILIKEGYDASGVLGWLAAMILVTQCANFFNFLVNKKNAVFAGLIAVLIGGYFVQYFELFNLPAFIGQGFDAIYANPILALIFLVVLVGLYAINYKQLKNEVYLDVLISEQTKEVNSADLSFTDKLGDLAPFIKNDLRLMWRNKRTKSGIWMLVLGLLYGLYFYPQTALKDFEVIYVLVGIFSTGTLLINFGQFIPAWDSGYYKMLMSQNFKYERYLKSKFMILTISVVLLFVLGIPYVYFGWKVLLVHFAAMIYNIGVNSHVILYGGTFNRKKINLNEKAAFNFQGTGAVQWIIGFPLMLLPMAIFGLINWLVSFEIATATLAIMGFIGIALHNKLMASITKKYIDNKYVMIHAFNQEN
ncbi:DUF5687 family protein [Polaribacter sp. R77954]|uniref:DUF5687 family protein n=1 Tax=Polaribacter sp. R77954 TaxID=3093870 RepID=UPI0037C55B84